mmetsp:Transcript_74997/g.213310  ORF Transcript_74997/g.213310 Transcript_74997/m.213310 type:complete len:85 (-) Transcript_74997:256-510(-)
MAAVSAVPLLGWLQIIAFAGYAETKLLQKFNGNPAGDVGGDKWQRYEEPIKSQKLLIELKNGRLAMLGMTGMLVGERLCALFTQ